MRFLAYVAIASIAVQCSTVFVAQGNCNVQQAFTVFNYVSDILPEAPEHLLKVSYPSIAVCLGNEISQTRLSVPPSIHYDFKPGVNYSIIMIDPDVPSAQAPLLKNFLHWFEVNLNNGTGCNTGEVIAKYIPPTPYPGSGPHRYMLLLFAQTKPIDVGVLLNYRFGVKRYKFSVIELAKEYGLKLVAGNFFFTSIPSIVEEFYCTGPSCTRGA